MKEKRILLATVTGEPFQPVRLYWSIPAKALATRIFTGLRCMDEDRGAGCWVWLYEHEAAPLTFLKPWDAVPPELHPIVIGRFRMPAKGDLVMELRSFERAAEAAKFFAPRFGPTAVLQRARLINRWFEGSEAAGGLDHLDRLLDANVVKIDPRDAEKAMKQAFEGAQTQEEKMRALERYHQELLRQDVPLVEDFPLAPEEETPEFRHLTTTLRLRTLRACEHWKGNHVTLAQVIDRAVAQGGAAGPKKKPLPARRSSRR